MRLSAANVLCCLAAFALATPTVASLGQTRPPYGGGGGGGGYNPGRPDYNPGRPDYNHHGHRPPAQCSYTAYGRLRYQGPCELSVYGNSGQRGYKVSMGRSAELFSRQGPRFYRNLAGGVTQPVTLQQRGQTLSFFWDQSSRLTATVPSGYGPQPPGAADVGQAIGTILDYFFGR